MFGAGAALTAGAAHYYFDKNALAHDLGFLGEQADEWLDINEDPSLQVFVPIFPKFEPFTPTPELPRRDARIVFREAGNTLFAITDEELIVGAQAEATYMFGGAIPLTPETYGLLFFDQHKMIGVGHDGLLYALDDSKTFKPFVDGTDHLSVRKSWQSIPNALGKRNIEAKVKALSSYHNNGIATANCFEFQPYSYINHDISLPKSWVSNQTYRVSQFNSKEDEVLAKIRGRHIGQEKRYAMVEGRIIDLAHFRGYAASTLNLYAKLLSEPTQELQLGGSSLSVKYETDSSYQDIFKLTRALMYDISVRSEALYQTTVSQIIGSDSTHGLSPEDTFTNMLASELMLNYLENNPARVSQIGELSSKGRSYITQIVCSNFFNSVAITKPALDITNVPIAAYPMINVKYQGGSEMELFRPLLNLRPEQFPVRQVFKCVDTPVFKAYGRLLAHEIRDWMDKRNP